MTDALDFQLQESGATRPNRYPEIFEAVRQICASVGKKKPKVLSFGCSTGEEPFSLAVDYLRDAEIVALDTNTAALQIAKSSHSLPGRITYDISTPDALERYGPFDVIFAMSVLCRWPTLSNTFDSSDVFPFSHYLEIVERLDRALKPGGILAIFNSNYTLVDTDLISRYDIIFVPGLMSNSRVKHFDTANIEIHGYCGTDAVYRKQMDAQTIRAGVKVLRIADPAGNPIGTLVVDVGASMNSHAISYSLRRLSWRTKWLGRRLRGRFRALVSYAARRATGLLPKP